MLSLSTAFKYGSSCVFANVKSFSDVNLVSISAARFLSFSGLLTSKSIVNVSVRLDVSLPAILKYN